MPKYVQAGTIYPYHVVFEVDGELVSPTSATITLTDNAGSVVQSINNSAITIAANSTDAIYNIPANANAKTLNSELRFVEIKFVYGGVTYTIRDNYEIKPSLQQLILPQEVRDYLSLVKSELPDSAIDLFNSYNELDADVAVDIGNIISSGSALLPYVRKAWLAKTAINCSHLLELRVMQSEQSDNTVYKRFADTDFQAIRDRLQLDYNNAIRGIEEVDRLGGTSVTGFLVVTGTDPVTGV